MSRVRHEHGGRRPQAVDVAELDGPAASEVRHRFESRWNRWNAARTLLATTAVLLLAAALALP